MDFQNLDEIIDFAIEREKEAAAFYRELKDLESFSGAKRMLEDYAKEEDKHVKLLEDFKTNTIDKSIKEYKYVWIPDIKRSNYVTDVEYKPGMSYREILLIAIKREEKALKLYNDMLAKAETDAGKKILKVLCQEEAKHKLALETMYDDYMAEMGD